MFNEHVLVSHKHKQIRYTWSKTRPFLISQVIKNNETIGQKYQYFSANIKMPILSH